jgi:hypothetical protein
MNINYNKINILFNEAFQAIIVCYTLLLCGETIQPGLISNIVNLNQVLLISILFGLLAILTSDHAYVTEKSSPGKITEVEWYARYLISIIGGLIVYYESLDIGGISIVTGIIAGVVVFILTFDVYKNT